MKVSIALLTAALTTLPLTAAAQSTPAPSPESSPTTSDLNATRLLFSPTGRPLAKGEGYFSDHMLVFPGVSYGITDHFSISGGASVIPGIGVEEQVFYVAPKFGGQVTKDLAVSGGLLYGHGGGSDGVDLGVGYAMATIGPPSKSLTLGAGVVRSSEERHTGRQVRGVWQPETRTVVSHTPVVMAGGSVLLSRRIALVSENWLILNDEFKLNDQPFGLGVRFLGDRLSADVGVVLVGSLLDDGLPLPWASVTYRFGPYK